MPERSLIGTPFTLCSPRAHSFSLFFFSLCTPARELTHWRAVWSLFTLFGCRSRREHTSETTSQPAPNGRQRSSVGPPAAAGKPIEAEEEEGEGGRRGRGGRGGGKCEWDVVWCLAERACV
eukprot:3799308-Rhodomonas_salina.1